MLCTRHLCQAAKMAFQTPPEVLFRNVLRHKSVTAARTASSGSGLPSHFQAAMLQDLGQPMVVQRLPMPTDIMKDQILVEVEAAAVNFSDILKAAGQYQVKATVPYVPGAELCGRVRAVGEGVKNFHIGQKVVGLASKGDGAFAEYCLLHTKTVLPVPDALSPVTGASMIISYGTSMMALTRTAKVKAGETVLVTAAAGATGMAAVDIAAHVLGTEVIAVCGGAEKCALAKERGAHHTIDYNSENLREKVKEITQGRGVNVVLDQVGGDIFLQCLKSIAEEGRLVTVGYASGKIPSIPANLLLLKSCSVHGVFWGNTSVTNPPVFFKSIQDTMTALQQGKIKPYCGQTFPLNQVNEAFDLVKSRKSTGKVVIVPSPNS
ncbi:quinone oxidoreductase-like protein 2 homolog isoform X1 [Haliotis cracherodii]|uniref:quinone oxidoreductase-like protein 2 homolog isoform X1 n=1 Tax=Haliotis cracherodii TaxID=6455 RepID=UPI0039EBCC19